MTLLNDTMTIPHIVQAIVILRAGTSGICIADMNILHTSLSRQSKAVAPRQNILVTPHIHVSGSNHISTYNDIYKI